ncbi:MAG: Fic family protein [Myxococcota bacterium]
MGRGLTLIVSCDTIGIVRPPFEVTERSRGLLLVLERLLGRYEGMHQPRPAPRLRRSLRVKTVHGSVAIEGNTLTEDQVTAVLEGRRVVAPRRDIVEVQNALKAYERLPEWAPTSTDHLLAAHSALMTGLLESAGHWRRGGVGVMKGKQIAHIAPPAKRVPGLVAELLAYLERDIANHPAVLAAVIHHELEFIHPFDDGNGRIGRLWHTLILSRYHPLFAFVPVESVIRERQSAYYDALEASDRAGSSTVFIEFALEATCDAVEKTLGAVSRGPVTPEQRLDVAAEQLGTRLFSRKEYQALFPGLSTATASRDLRQGVDAQRLRRTGDKALARYAFVKRR